MLRNLTPRNRRALAQAVPGLFRGLLPELHSLRNLTPHNRRVLAQTGPGLFHGLPPEFHSLRNLLVRNRREPGMEPAQRPAPEQHLPEPVKPLLLHLGNLLSVYAGSR